MRKVLKVGGTGSTKETKKEESRDKEKTRSSDKKREKDSGVGGCKKKYDGKISFFVCRFRSFPH